MPRTDNFTVRAICDDAIYPFKQEIQMNKLFYALFSFCILSAGNQTFAMDAMSKDAMKMDAMKKDDMNKGAMKMDDTKKKSRKKAMKKDSMGTKEQMDKSSMGKGM